MNGYRPLLAQLGSEVLLGLSYLFLALGMSHMEQDAPRFLAMRYTVATLCFVLLVRMGFQKVRYSLDKIPLLLVCGLLNPIISQLAKTVSTIYVSTTRLSMCNSIIPVVMIGVSALLNREYPTKKQLLFVCTTAVGVLIANMESWTMDGQAGEPMGYFWVGLYIAAISVSRACVHRATRRSSAFEISCFATGVGCLGFVLMDWIIPSVTPVTAQLPLLMEPTFVVALIYTSMGTCVMAFLLMNYASSELPFAVYSSTCTINVVVGILAGALLLGETIVAREIVGVIIILGSVVGISFTYDKSKGGNRFAAEDTER